MPGRKEQFDREIKKAASGSADIKSFFAVRPPEPPPVPPMPANRNIKQKDLHF